MKKFPLASLLMLSALSAVGHAADTKTYVLQNTASTETPPALRRRRKKKGGGRGGFHPPRHARARAHKKAFGGICGPRIDATNFFYA